MMSIEVRPATLIAGLKAVKPAVGTRSGQALSGVRIFKRPGENLRIYATDFDLSVTRPLPHMNHVDEVDLLVSHADLAKAAALLKSEPSITLALNDAGDHVDVKGLKRTIALRTLRLEDHPPQPSLTGAMLLVSHDAKELRGVVERALTFAGTDHTRPVLTGVQLDLREGEPAVFCATDSYRLGVLRLPGAPAAITADALIPGRLLKTALKNAKAGSVSIEVAGTHVSITNHDEPETWIARRLEGQFPNYRQLIPDTWPHELIVPTSEMISACDLAVAFCRKKAPMRLSVNGATKVTGSTPDEADFEEILAGARHTVNGQPQSAEDSIEIGLNPEFMRDITKVTRSKDMVIRMISPLRPALVEDQDDRYLLMSIRLNV